MGAANSTIDLTATGAAHNARWFELPCGIYVSSSSSYWMGVMLQSRTTQPTIYYDTGGSDVYFTANGLYLVDGSYYSNTTSANQYSIRGSLIH